MSCASLTLLLRCPIKNKRAGFYAFAGLSIRWTARVIEAGVRRHSRAAVVGGVVTFEQYGFVGAHLRKIVPLMTRSTPERERLAAPMRIDQIAGDEIIHADGLGVADGERRFHYR